MESLRRDILVTFHNLMKNLGLKYQIDDVNYLAHENIYIEIFRTMFPALILNIMKISQQAEYNKGDRIQNLIGMLSTEILNLDLSHIRGALIAKGDSKHIINFLQLLFEISKMFLQKKEQQPTHSKATVQKSSSGKLKQTGSSGSESQKAASKKQPHRYSEPQYEDDVKEEDEEDSMSELFQDPDSGTEEIVHILNKPGSKKRAHDGTQGKQSANYQSENVSRISEVSKSKESSEYDSYNKKLSARQPKKRAQSFEERQQGSQQKKQGYDNEKDLESDEEYNSEGAEDEEERIYRKLNKEAGLDYDDSESMQYYKNEEEYIRALQKQAGGRYGQQQAHAPIPEDADENASDYQKVQEEIDSYGQVEAAEEELERLHMMQSKAGQQHHQEERRLKSKSRGNRSGKKTQKQNKDLAKQKFNPKNVQMRYIRTTPYVVEQPYSYKPSRSVAKQVMKKRPKTANVRTKGDDDALLHHSQSKKHLDTIEEIDRDQMTLQDEQKARQYDEGGIEEETDEEEQESEYDGNESEKNNIEAYQDETRNVPLPEDNMLYNILAENIKNVRDNLQGMRDAMLPEDEPLTSEIILQQKNNYKSYLNDYLKDHKVKENKSHTQKSTIQKNNEHTIKAQMRNDEKLNEELEGQQKSLVLKQRDEKINYLRKIHKIVFELEKKKLIEEKKEYMEIRRYKNYQTRNIIESVENMYKNKLDLLREKQLNDQTERHLVQNAQKKLLRDLEKELKRDKMREIETLKNKWRSEKEKFQGGIRDDGYLEQRIMELYKRFA